MNDYKKPEVKGAKTTLRVVCIPDSFRRAGRRWSGITDVLASEFTQEQLDAIMSEPNLYSHWLIDIDAPISPNPSPVDDLLSDAPRTETQKQPGYTTPTKEQIPAADITIDNEWKTKNEREFLYRTIGGLVLLLIEKTQSKKFGSRDKPIKSGIYNAIGEILENMDFKTDGQTKTILNEVLEEALNTAMTPKND
ncbi:MAG: hypothetical protein EPN89_02325 [Methylovulum sp.]|nr:MAG: hypothetical protein EPN89_02325 [Methylovulum sp.]